VLAVVGAMTAAECRAGGSAVRAGFWFDQVTFELPARETGRIGGPIRNEEKERIRSIAFSELKTAYSGLRLELSNDHRTFYRVSVVQDLGEQSRLARGAAGESHAFGPLGGSGSVSFLILARNAVSYAPPKTDRAAIIQGIGRGIGRAAAHEFAHQIVGGTLDATTDRDSYEYGSADRAAQYYGTLHWNGAWETLVRKIGR
jgi:hypothetical protein